MGELDRLIRQQRRAGWPGVGPCQFNDKADLRPLQSADVLAYELLKRVRDMCESPEKLPKRALRKSLKSIIEGNRSHKRTVMTRPLIHKFLSSLR